MSEGLVAEICHRSLRAVDGVNPHAYSARLARVVDLASIRAIEAKAEYREFIGTWSDRQYRDALENPADEVVVAECGETLAGFYILREIGGKDRCVNLMRIAVEEPGSGAGGYLLTHALHRAFEHHNAHRLWLDVFTTNHRAQRAYRKYGFVQEGILRDVKLRDGRFQSQAIMSMLEEEYRGMKR